MRTFIRDCPAHLNTIIKNTITIKSYSLILHSVQNMTFLVLNHIFLLLQIFSNDNSVACFVGPMRREGRGVERQKVAELTKPKTSAARRLRPCAHISSCLCRSYCSKEREREKFFRSLPFLFFECKY